MMPDGRSAEKLLLVARPRGFCAGVERAIATVEHLLRSGDGTLYVRKEIVHNRAVVDDFARRGVVFVDELDEVPDGSTVVFSAHGVSPQVREDAARRGLRVVDATCPLVTKVHRQVARNAARGRRILLIGHEGHDEVVGTMGEAEGRITLVTGEAEAAQLELPADGELYYVTQTTLGVEETEGIIAALKRRRPDIEGPQRSDICYATQNRQDAVKALVAEGIERLLVVGSANSSNSRRLCEVARRDGVPADLVGGVADLPRAELSGAVKVGLTAGASAPEYLVQDIVEDFLANKWEIQEHIVMEEDTKFDLPAELRGKHDS
jgi:4-hydroxy-3-methylbut-2-enyl diphosphate reductase